MGINTDNPIVQQASQDVQQAAQTLLEDIQSYKNQQDVASLLPKGSKLAGTADNLIKNLFEVTHDIKSALSATDPLGDIEMNSAKLLEVTRIWATFRDALDQRNGSQPYFQRLLLALNLIKPMQSKRDSLIEAVAIGDQVVKEFYEIAHEKNLTLRAQDVKLITVLRDDRTHSEAFGEPTPFIVGPLWGYNQAWNYIAYAHEVGHHIYRNVDGLDCELLVNVMLTLGVQGCTHKEVRIWGSWLEEIFADLFCVLRVGPAAIHAGQRVALWITATSRRAEPSSDTLTRILFTSRDLSHPVSYLRVCMGLKALKLLANKGPSDIEVQKQIQELEDRWVNLAAPPTNIYINDKQENFAKIFERGELVVATVLDTPLYALANKNDGLSSVARSIFDVFYDDSRFMAGMKVNEGKEEMWQILATTEFARDMLHDEASLQNLHNEAFKLLRQ
jgi:hypothetical protein